MNILYLTENKSGCWQARVRIPAEELKKRGHQIQVITTKKDVEKLEVPDVAVLLRGYNVDTTGFVKALKQFGKKIVYETDDALDLIQTNNPHFGENQKNVQEMKDLIADADLVTTTTPTLAEHLNKYNGNVAVLPNCVIPEEWQKRKGGNKKLRIGFTGGSSHISDLLLVLDVIRDLQKKHDFTFVLFGFCPVPLQEWYDINAKQEWFKDSEIGVNMKRMIDGLKGIKHEFHPFIPVDQYNKKLSDLNLDIGICPLVENKFNSMKSCIKFYEYAMCGTAVMTSDVLPYSQEVAYRAKNRYIEWFKKLERLMLDKKLRQGLATEQRDWVLKNRDIKNNIHLWEQAYGE